MSLMDTLTDPTLVLLGGLIFLLLLGFMLGWAVRGEHGGLNKLERENDEATRQLLERANRDVAQRDLLGSQSRRHVRAMSEPLKPSYPPARKS